MHRERLSSSCIPGRLRCVGLCNRSLWTVARMLDPSVSSYNQQFFALSASSSIRQLPLVKTDIHDQATCTEDLPLRRPPTLIPPAAPTAWWEGAAS
jgi:hypothetical protein